MRSWAAPRSRKMRFAIGSSPSRMFSATVRTGTSMKCWCTMLMPWRMASAGPLIVAGAPFRRISPLSGVAEPVEDVHERRLAGAVLAEQGVDLAGPDVEVDAVVGEHAGVALRDPAHLEHGRALGLVRGRFVGHRARPERVVVGRRRADRSGDRSARAVVRWEPALLARSVAGVSGACVSRCSSPPRSCRGRGRPIPSCRRRRRSWPAGRS